MNIKIVRENSDLPSQKPGNITSSTTSTSSGIKEKKWELLGGVKKGLEEIAVQSRNNPEIKSLIENTDKLKDTREKILRQEEELKLSLLISSRERNVYLEKLRKIEEFGEEKNWEDEEGLLKDIYGILYCDN